MSIAPNTEVRLLSNVPLKTYRHQLLWDTGSEQSLYFKSKTAHTFTDFTYQRETRSIRVPKNRDELYNCNYLMYWNQAYGGKWFFAFITSIEYVNPNMAEVHFEIDAFQTWQFAMNFHSSYVVREHQNRWNADGSPVINTVDEGLDYGTEYETRSIGQYVPFGDVFFLVIACKQRMDVNGNSEIDPVINGGVQPLTYYVHPFKMDGTTPAITVDGVSQTLSPVTDVLKALYKSTGAVNNIVSLYVTEYIGHPSLDFPMSKFEPVNIQDSTTNFVTLYVNSMPTYSVKSDNAGNKYTGFATVTESKLMMHPYCVTILTDMKGNFQEIKNEYIQGQDLQIRTLGSIGTSNKVAYYLADYLMDSGLTNLKEVAFEKGIVNNSANDVPIITDLLSAYLQGNKNTLENTKNSIQFNGVMGGLSGIVGGVTSAFTRNAGGALSSAMSGISSTQNAQFAIEGLNAKQKDLNATPPQLAKMGGNTAFDYGNEIKGLYIIKKQITAEYRKKLSDYFKMFGYKCNELKVPNLKTRQHFNYIQTAGANISGDIPEEDIQKIRDMFDNGVTLWHGDWIGDYSVTNGEI